MWIISRTGFPWLSRMLLVCVCAVYVCFQKQSMQHLRTRCRICIQSQPDSCSWPFLGTNGKCIAQMEYHNLKLNESRLIRSPSEEFSCLLFWNVANINSNYGSYFTLYTSFRVWQVILSISKINPFFFLHRKNIVLSLLPWFSSYTLPVVSKVLCYTVKFNVWISISIKLNNVKLSILK